MGDARGRAGGEGRGDAFSPGEGRRDVRVGGARDSEEVGLTELLLRLPPGAPAPPLLEACLVLVMKIKMEGLRAPHREEQPSPQAVEHSTLCSYTQAELVDLSSQFQQKPLDLLPTRLVHLWDLGVEGIVLSGPEMGKLASLTTHSALWQRLQNAHQTPRNHAFLDWLTAALKVI